MARRRRRRTSALPFALAELSLAACETVVRRTLMMAQGTCTPAEYRRMVREKVQAAAASGRVLARGGRSPAALLAPWHGRATRNAKRLRKRKG